MCQGCETERRRKIVSRILPMQISMWSQHLITVIPSEVEAATQRTKSARPGFQSRGTIKGNIAGCLDFARHDKLFVRLGRICEVLRRFVLAHRDRNPGNG